MLTQYDRPTHINTVSSTARTVTMSSRPQRGRGGGRGGSRGGFGGDRGGGGQRGGQGGGHTQTMAFRPAGGIYL